jgi:peptide/nickel transport system permease protein
LGARPPAPEWGAMLNDARGYWVSAPWALIFPGVAITALVLGFNLLGDGLREALDPNAR